MAKGTTASKTTKKPCVGILGLGKMGEALARGLVARNYSVCGSVRTSERAAILEKEIGISVYDTFEKVLQNSSIIVISVKPHQAEDLLKAISKRLRKDQILISICASLTLKQLKQWTCDFPSIIRAMPNLPALIGEGMTVLCSEMKQDGLEMTAASEIFSAVGKVTTVEERLMDGVTGLSACGPAFIFLILEALSEAGVKVGISRKTSTLLAAQTMLGASRMVLSGLKHPAALKDEVTTPAGCTTDGLMALEEGRLRATLIKAVVAAAEKSAALLPRETH